MSEASSDAPVWTLDRFEETADQTTVAVLVSDDGSEMIVPRGTLPATARQGDVLRLHFAQDEDETSRRRAHVEDLQRRLFGPPDGGS